MSQKIISKKQLTTLLILIFGIGLSYLGFSQKEISQVTTELQNIQPGYYLVTEVSDGDTFSIDMNGSTERIRMIGVDTPETHHPNKAVQCFGEKASEFTKNLISNKPVRLEADPTNTNRDRYNRLLRYVYLEDSTLVNAEIIKQGYGFAYIAFPFEKKDAFSAYQRTAREENKGLWNDCSVEKDGLYQSTNDAQSDSE